MADRWIQPDRYWLIPQRELDGWLDGLAQNHTLIAPRQQGQAIRFGPVAGSAGIAAGYPRPVLSIKEFFLPASERLLQIRRKGGEVELEEQFLEKKQIIFAARPCEARAMILLDAVFRDAKPADPYYCRRRENTAIIALACTEMGESCFCTSMGGAPDDPAGADILLHQTEAGFLVRAASERGRFLIPGAEWPQTDLTPKPIPGKEAIASIPAREALIKEFNDAYWELLGERCLSCRACSYVCPTCRCFVIRDEALPEAGEFERIRGWDACTGRNYRRVAGGHQPRPGKGERIRNRMLCKFMYFAEQYHLANPAACTGCGRCVEVCPVNIDISEVLADLGRRA